MNAPKIALIVAMAENRVIGADNKLLWHIPEDLRHFKNLTLGKPVIMGRRTFESIGRPLPNRTNIVISRQNYAAGGIIPVKTLESAFIMAENFPSGEIMVIGGAQVYKAALPFATSVYLTHIHKAYDGDALFPVLDGSEWAEVSRQPGADCVSAGINYEFVTYQRI